MHGDDEDGDAAADRDSDEHAADEQTAAADDPAVADDEPARDETTAADDESAERDAEADGESESVEGVDTEHVMNLTFVLTLLVGVPTVVVLSLFVPLDGWNEILGFVVRVGAGIWFLTAVTLYVRERLKN